MYVCCECGEEFEKPITWSEPRGEFWGVACSEQMTGSPCCQGNFEEKSYGEEEDEEERKEIV